MSFDFFFPKKALNFKKKEEISTKVHLNCFYEIFPFLSKI